MTGLTEQMKSNFHLMNEMGQHTRVSPSNRAKSMLAFINRLRSHETSQRRLENWEVNFNPDLVRLEGRTLTAEKILLGLDNQTGKNKLVDSVSST